MATSKLIKIKINKFGNVHGEIYLKNCTLINCDFLSQKEINELAKIMKFMFTDDHENVPEINIQDDWPFVEIHIQTVNDQLCIMRKSYKHDALIYEIDETETTAVDFYKKLSEFECLFSFTSYLCPKVIENLMNVNENTRINLLESICGNVELKTRFNQHNTRMEELEFQMKYLNDHKKELFMEKKLEKLRIENSKKIKDATNEFEQKYEEMMLLHLYHNELKFTEKIPEKLERFFEQLVITRDDFKDIHLRLTEVMKHKIISEREMFVADLNIENAIQIFVNYQKNIIDYQNELESLTDQKKWSDIAAEGIRKIKSHNDEVRNTLLGYNQLYKKHNASMKEYIKMESQFLEENSNYILFKIAKRRMDQLKMINSKIGKYKKHLKILNDEQSIYNNELVNLTDKEILIQDKLNKIKGELKFKRLKFSKLESDTKTAKKFIAEKALEESNELNSIKRIELKLREQFPESIIGVLSELFDVKDVNGLSVTKSQILKCLGDYSNAIVVENRQILKKVMTYLVKQQYDVTKVKLVAQKHFQMPADLRNVKISNMNISSIHNFLLPISEEINKILLHFLHPTVICDCKLIGEIEKIYDKLGKKFKIISFVAGISYNGFRSELFASDSNLKTVVETANEVVENNIKLIGLRIDLKVLKHKFMAYFERLNNTKVLSKWAQEALLRNMKLIEFLSGKVSKLEEMKSQLDSSDSYKNVYDTLKEKFQPMMNEYFEDFCQKYNIQSLEDYQEILSELINYDSNHKSLNKTINILTLLENKLTKMIITQDFTMTKDLIESEIQKLNESLESVEEKFDEAGTENQKCYENWKNQIIQMDELKKNFEEVKDKLLTGFLNVISDISDIEFLLCENYMLLNQVLIDFEKVSLSNGSLLTQLRWPSNNEITADFDLVTYHMNQITINFDVLKDDLKNADNVINASNEIKNELVSLRQALSNFPLELGENDGDLTYITEKISGLSIEIKNTNNECQKVKGALKSVRTLRKNQLISCLNDINKEIKEYCRIVLNEECHGELLPTNENDPFLGTIQYFWNSNNGTQTVDDFNKNWNAALAFIFGILRYKRQNFLPYFETSSELPILKALVKYTTNADSKLQSIVFWKTGIKPERCHFTIMRFNDSIAITGNDEEQRKVQELLE